MKIKKGDQVLITAGKDKNKSGKVMRVSPKEGKIMVEGLNLRKKHIRPRKAGEKGRIMPLASFFDVSNAKLICPKCKKATRVGYQIEGSKKQRVCKKCKEIM